MGKAKIKVRTYRAAGRYQHEITTNRHGNDLNIVDDETIEYLKRANESAWEYAPVGTKGLVLKLEFKFPS